MRVLTTAIFLLATTGCVTFPEKMSDADLTEEVFRLAGFQKSIETVPVTLAESLSESQLGASLSVQGLSSLLAAMRRAFDPHELRKPIFRSLDERLSRRDKVAIVSWYRSKIGQTIKQQEAYSQSEEGRAQFQKWLVYIENENIQLTRAEVAFATDIAKHSGAISLAVNTSAAIFMGMSVGMNARMPRDRQVSQQELIKRGEFMRDRLVNSMGPAVLLSIHFAYGHLAKETKDGFLNFLKSRPGENLTQTAVTSFSQSFSIAAMQAGQSLAGRMAH